MWLPIFFSPLLAAILVSTFGRFFGRYGTAVISIGSIMFGAISSCLLFINQFYSSGNAESVVTLIVFNPWILTQFTTIDFALYIDTITLTMLVVVLSISSIVHLYSFDYLHGDPHLTRFFSYLSFFTFFMLVLVSANDLVTLFIGWEGVGLFSYLLINFWYTRLQANKSALKAIFINKIGDIGMLLALAFIYLLCGTTNISQIIVIIPYCTNFLFDIVGYSIPVLDIISICLLVAAIGKSAQLGLHVWLPDAMEGPTPVSALLHAATMVTAGVFLFIRLGVVVNASPILSQSLVVVGALTAFFAATTGLFQHDLKRIIAFSTCSQLGYMFVACGLVQFPVALFHLFNHAFFKALLFLSAGSIIHALQDEQDIRRMGYLVRFMPLTFSFFTIASFSLMGLPYLSGYYSKDLIIELSWYNSNLWAFFLINLAAFFTAMYSIRLLFYVFLAAPNFQRSVQTISDASLIVQIPLSLLASLSIITGYLFSEGFVGFGYNLFLPMYTSIQSLSVEVEFIPIYIKQLPFFGSLIFSYKIYKILLNWPAYTLRKILRPRKWGSFNYYYLIIFTFLNQKWFFDKIYNNIFITTIKLLYTHFFVFLEKGIFELVGPTGIFFTLNKISQSVTKSQNGSLIIYIKYIVSSFIFLIFILLPFYIYI